MLLQVLVFLAPVILGLVTPLSRVCKVSWCYKPAISESKVRTEAFFWMPSWILGPLALGSPSLLFTFRILSWRNLVGNWGRRKDVRMG